MSDSTHTTPGAATSAPVVKISNVSVAYNVDGISREVVHDVSFELRPGEITALVGQSGSGKSTLALALSGLLPDNGEITAGRVELFGRDVSDIYDEDWQDLRRTDIGYIPQDPLSSLDPLQKIGKQLARIIATGTEDDRGRGTRYDETIALLSRVGIEDPHDKYESFPHELSGGQIQRVLISAAIARKPKLLIADEPTSALDVTVQNIVLDLLSELQESLDLTVLFITHDLAIAKDRSDEVVVLSEGRVQEQGPTAEVLEAPEHEYTIRLLEDIPALNPDRYRDLKVSGSTADRSAAITVSGLTKSFTTGGPRGRSRFVAVDNVDLRVAQGTVHAIVGESGSGKSTIARIVAGLSGYDDGLVTVSDRELPRKPLAVNKHARQLQLVYQNALSVLDPRYTVERLIGEPLRVHGVRSATQRRRLTLEALERVKLPVSVLKNRPSEISGGQRQRVAIARALAIDPAILVLDEPTSALDVSVQSHIIDVLYELKQEFGLTYLFVSHDLSLVRQIADDVSVLAGGRIVESRPAVELFASPHSPYTRRLLDSIPGTKTVAAVVA